MNDNLLNEGMKDAILERLLIENKLTKNQYNRIRQYEKTHDVTLTTEEIMSRVRLKSFVQNEQKQNCGTNGYQ